MALESFFGLDQGEGMSEGALEALREKMREAAAQIAAIKKEESKQKKKEQDLLKILLRFVKNSQKSELVLLITHVLEQNIPANFVLAIVLLGNEEIQREVGSFLMLKRGEDSDEKSLTFFGEEDKTLPLKLKIEIDNWIKNMLSQAEETPQKLLRTAYDIEFIELPSESEFDEKNYEQRKTVKVALTQLVAFVLRDFLEQQDSAQDHEQLAEFAQFITTGILNKTEEGLDKRQLLGD